MAKPIDLPQLLGTFQSYPEEGKCVICQDFREVDHFAQVLKLQSILALKKSTVSTPGSLGGREIITDLESVITEFESQHGQLVTSRQGPADPTVREVLQRLMALEIPKDKERDEYLEKVQIECREAIQKIREKNPPDLDTQVQKAILKAQVDGAKFGDWDIALDKQVKILCRALWNAYVRAKVAACHTAAVSEAAIRTSVEKDNFAKARLAFAWITNSFKYNHDLQQKILRDEAETKRSIIKSIFSGDEVCEGIALLFKLFFDACYPNSPGATADNSGATPAVYIGGDGRSSFGGEQQDPDFKYSPHAWNAFPLGLDTPQDNWRHGYKIVDPTWAMPQPPSGQSAVPGSPNSLWWCYTNEAFGLTHFPDNYQKLYYDANIKDDDEWRAKPDLKQKTSTGGFTSDRPGKKKNLWLAKQPIFETGMLHETKWLDLSTLVLARKLNSTLTTTSAIESDTLEIPSKSSSPATITIAFKNNCTHQVAATPAFFLWFYNDEVDDWAKKMASSKGLPQLPSPVPFAVASSPPSRDRKQWMASLTLNRSVKPGTISIVVPFEKRSGRRLNDAAEAVKLQNTAQVDWKHVVTWYISYVDESNCKIS